jgi:hypothetical protein
MSVGLSESARALIESGALGHLVTVNREGCPQVESGDYCEIDTGEQKRHRTLVFAVERPPDVQDRVTPQAGSGW